jgi:rhodanese-related sulfurtransferase
MRTVIVDVRTPQEFNKRALPGAVNIPSSNFELADYFPYQANQICLVCESGGRAKSVMDTLKSHGFDNVSVLDLHMADIWNNYDSKSEWSIDRQFRLVLAIILGVFLVGYLMNGKFFLILPVIIFSGLLFSAITDNCYLKEMIAKFPWNQNSLPT